MNATNAYPAEITLPQVPMSWPEFVILGLVVLTLSALAVLAPLRARRQTVATDLLQD